MSIVRGDRKQTTNSNFTSLVNSIQGVKSNERN